MTTNEQAIHQADLWIEIIHEEDAPEREPMEKNLPPIPDDLRSRLQEIVTEQRTAREMK